MSNQAATHKKDALDSIEEVDRGMLIGIGKVKQDGVDSDEE